MDILAQVVEISNEAIQKKRDKEKKLKELVDDLGAESEDAKMITDESHKIMQSNEAEEPLPKTTEKDTK